MDISTIILKKTLMEPSNDKENIKLDFGPYPAMNVGNKDSKFKKVVINENETPLSLACSQGKYYLVKSLIERGYDINQIDYLNYTPIARAAVNGHLDIARLLVSYGAKINYNLLSLIKSRIDALEEDVKKGKEDTYTLANWKNFLDYLIEEGKKQI
jgi:ankyrin repeat protein